MNDPLLISDPLFLSVQQALAGDYSLERELGRGGMGVVYLAREVALDRLVALKVLPPALAARGELRERFLTEARTAARLSHPNIVPIHRVGDVDGVVFFAMSYIKGETLGERLRARGPLPGGEVLRVVRETAWALAYAHGQGIVHRDVKPENILIEAGTDRVLVADFGIAQVGGVVDGANVTHVSGTAQYMSPEQAVGGPVDGRSDLYALGVMAYLCLTGRLPFDADNVADLLEQHLRAPVPALQRANVSAGLVQVVYRCLAKSPDDRFANGEALVETLDAVHATRRELSPVLRAWADERDPFVPFYLLFNASMLASTVQVLAQFGGYNVAGMIARNGTMMIMPWAFSIAFHLVRTWRVVRRGYGVAELREAIDDAVDREQETRLSDRVWSGNPLTRVMRVASVVATAALILAPTLVLVLRRSHGLGALLMNHAGSIVLVSGLLIWASSAFGISLPGGSVMARVRGWRNKLWHGALGARVASVLARIAPRHDAHPALVERPTEIMLEAGAQRLFDALPTTLRETMPEFRRVLEELANVASRARERRQELLAAQGDSPGNDELLQRSLADAERELSDAVQAMERLRLGVMRLYAGANKREHHTTLQLELHAVTAQLQRLVSADREISVMLSPSANTASLGSSHVATGKRAKRHWWSFATVSHPTPTS